jgi:hypothetical protein
MSNDPYQQQSFWTDTNICLEKDKDGKCLVSARYVFLDSSQEQKHKLFCNQIKTKKHDKTI